MSLQEQAAQMIYELSDDDAVFIIDFIKRYIISENDRNKPVGNKNSSAFMEELENMRLKLKSDVPPDFDPKKAWEEAMNEKYNSIN